MHMGMEPGMEMELAVATAQQDILELQTEFKDLHKMVTGNGDPQKGLIWMATLHARLLADLSTIVEANRATLVIQDAHVARALEEHKEKGHYERASAQQRLAYKILEHVLSVVVSGLVVLIILGAVSYLNGHRL